MATTPGRRARRRATAARTVLISGRGGASSAMPATPSAPAAKARAAAITPSPFRDAGSRRLPRSASRAPTPRAMRSGSRRRARGGSPGSRARPGALRRPGAARHETREPRLRRGRPNLASQSGLVLERPGGVPKQAGKVAAGTALEEDPGHHRVDLVGAGAAAERLEHVLRPCPDGELGGPPEKPPGGPARAGAVSMTAPRTE